jgi:hypothetical protein
MYELLQENEYSDIEVSVKISSCEQSVCSDDEENVRDNCSMLHDIQAKSSAEQPHFSIYWQAWPKY